MDNGLVVLLGTALGSLMGFLATSYLERVKAKERVKIAELLFHFLHKEWLRADLLDKAERQRKAYDFLLSYADQIREAIIASANEKIVRTFHSYDAILRQLNNQVQQGQKNIGELRGDLTRSFESAGLGPTK